jgi:N-acetylneuraminic acid mutarotase
MKKLTAYILVVLLFSAFHLPLKSQDSSWVITDTMPVPVAGGQAVVGDSLIYILGGYLDAANIQSSLSDIIQVYDPYHNHWVIINVFMNTGRAGFVTGIYDNKLYYAGGVWELLGRVGILEFKQPSGIFEFQSRICP